MAGSLADQMWPPDRAEFNWPIIFNVVDREGRHFTFDKIWRSSNNVEKMSKFSYERSCLGK